MPNAAQPKSRHNVVIGKDAICTKQIPAPNKGIIGTNGTLKGRGMSGCAFLKNIIEQHTIANANIVPTDTNSARACSGSKPANKAEITPAIICAFLGTPFLVTLDKNDGKRWSLEMA